MRSSKEILLVHLRRIASADTVEEFEKEVKILKEFEKEVKILKEGEIWKLEQGKKKFLSWMEKTWPPEHKAKIFFFLIRSCWREIL